MTRTEPSSDLTHADLLAAVQRQRDGIQKALCSYDPAEASAGEHLNDHCGDLEAILRRHTSYTNGDDLPRVVTRGTFCHWCVCAGSDHQHDGTWPCPDVQQVIDRLNSWGVL